MAEYTYGKDFAIRTETDCIATEDDFGQYVGRTTAVKIKTNGDRIRSMSDEELVEIMAHGNCGYCKIHDYCFSQKGVDCDEAWLDWLKSPAEEGKL